MIKFKKQSFQLSDLKEMKMNEMHIDMKIIIILFFLCILLFLIFLLFRNCSRARAEKNNFIKYARDKKDIDILYELGYCNINGFEETRRVPFRNKILIGHYEKNNDERYFVYAKFLENNSLKIFIITFFIFVCICGISSAF